MVVVVVAAVVAAVAAVLVLLLHLFPNTHLPIVNLFDDMA